jgi:GT2 family glycosyltransferase
MDRVLACITTRDGNPPTLVREMLDAACRALAVAGVRVELSIQQDRYSVAYCRNQAVHDCLKNGFSHLFFCDDDVYVPEHTLVDLHAMNRGIAAGLVPSIKTAYPGDLQAETYVQAAIGGQWSRHWFSGIRQVDVVGGGCMLIKRGVFEKVGFPWFRWPEGIVNGEHIRKSDDLDFCERAIAAGIGVWANGDVRCGHVKAVDIANFITEESAVLQEVT